MNHIFVFTHFHCFSFRFHFPTVRKTPESHNNNERECEETKWDENKYVVMEWNPWWFAYKVAIAISRRWGSD